MNSLQYLGVFAAACAVIAGLLAGLQEPHSELRGGLGAYAGILLFAAFAFAVMGAVIR